MGRNRGVESQAVVGHSVDWTLGGIALHTEMVYIFSIPYIKYK